MKQANIEKLNEISKQINSLTDHFIKERDRWEKVEAEVGLSFDEQERLDIIIDTLDDLDGCLIATKGIIQRIGKLKPENSIRVTLEIKSEIHNGTIVCGECFSFNQLSTHCARCEHFDTPLATAPRPIPTSPMKFACCDLCVKAQDQDRS